MRSAEGRCPVNRDSQLWMYGSCYFATSCIEIGEVYLALSPILVELLNGSNISRVLCGCLSVLSVVFFLALCLALRSSGKIGSKIALFGLLALLVFGSAMAGFTAINRVIDQKEAQHIAKQESKTQRVLRDIAGAEVKTAHNTVSTLSQQISDTKHEQTRLRSTNYITAAGKLDSVIRNLQDELTVAKEELEAKKSVLQSSINTKQNTDNTRFDRSAYHYYLALPWGILALHVAFAMLFSGALASHTQDKATYSVMPHVTDTAQFGDVQESNRLHKPTPINGATLSLPGRTIRPITTTPLDAVNQKRQQAREQRRACISEILTKRPHISVRDVLRLLNERGIKASENTVRTDIKALRKEEATYV